MKALKGQAGLLQEPVVSHRRSVSSITYSGGSRALGLAG